MPQQLRRRLKPPRIPPEVFRYGGYEIVGEYNSPNWYRRKYVSELGDMWRESLGTDDFEAAKDVLIRRVNRDFEDVDAQRGDPLVISVIEGCTSDPENEKKWTGCQNPLKIYAREHWQGVTMRGLTPGMRRTFAQSVLERGCSPGHAANMLGVLSGSFKWAGRVRDDGSVLCVDPPRIECTVKAVCRLTKALPPPPRNYSPEPEEMVEVVRFLATLGEEASLWALNALFTTGRPTVVRLLGSGSMASRFGSTILDLHPKDWRRTQKRNACLPLPDTMVSELRMWPEGRWLDGNANWLAKIVAAAARAVGLPELIPTSFRDYTATALRHAHITHGVERVPETDVEAWMGHGLPYGDDNPGRTVNSRYGMFSPEYLRLPMLAAEAAVLDLHHRSGGGLFRRSRPILRQNSAKSLEGDGDKFGEFRRAGGPACRSRAEVVQTLALDGGTGEPLSLSGIQAGKPVQIGGIRGSFRQLSANRSTHLDAAFEPADTDFLRGSDVHLLRFVPYSGNVKSSDIVIVRK